MANKKSDRVFYTAPRAKEDIAVTEIAKNTLEVGTNGAGEVVVNHPDLQPDENGVGHIVFSPEQARHLAFLLQRKADSAEEEIIEKRRQEAEKIPVDRSAQILTDGLPVPEDRSHTKLRADGQQEGYVALNPQERSKGFVRPYRDAYRHLKCGKITKMSQSIAETYARDPGFYNGTFCTTCGAHFPIGEEGEFVWYEMNGTTGPKVGT
jgi:hypothetical protein